MELLVLAAQPIRTQAVARYRKQAVLACLLALTALVFCPEYGIQLSSETAHILTVIVGGLVVLVPIGYLLPVIVPYRITQARMLVAKHSLIRRASEERC